MNITIVGGGSMGYAFAVLCLEKGLCAVEALCVIEQSEERRLYLGAQLGCRVTADLAVVREAELVLMAVKPQDMSAACRALQPFIPPSATVLSIMAGVTIEALRRELAGHAKLVRCMPNTPLQIGMGVTAYFAADAVDDAERERVERVLRAGGIVMRVVQEDQLDGVTALSGSGPAYVFYMIEAFLEAAAELGFSDVQAKQLVAQTFLGATTLWRDGDLPPAELRRRVTSKGGTTEAALRVFETYHVQEALRKGALRACERSRELRAGGAKD